MTLPLLDTAAGPSTAPPGSDWPRLVAVAFVVACAALSGPCECRRVGAWWAVDAASASPTRTTATEVSGKASREETAGAARGPSAAEEPSLQALGLVQVTLRTPHPPPVWVLPGGGRPTGYRVARAASRAGPSIIVRRMRRMRRIKSRPEAMLNTFRGLGGLRRMRRIIDRR